MLDVITFSQWVTAMGFLNYEIQVIQGIPNKDDLLTTFYIYFALLMCPNALETIDNETFNLIIYCFRCVRHMRSATFETCRPKI